MINSKKALYLTQQIRQCERMALDELGLTEEELMLRAGTAAFKVLETLYPDIRTIAIFCGGGNNAGDGYIVASLAFEQGLSVIIYQCMSVEDLPEVARHAALKAMAIGISCLSSLDDIIDSDVELVVDALLGIGIKGNVRGSIAQAINLINDSGLPVLALDVPSGLEVDTGRVLGVCINAAVTITFIASKIGLYTLDGPDHAGKVICDSLQLDSCFSKIKPAANPLDETLFHGILSPRLKNSHKGSYGHVLVIGGGRGMPGAVYLSALAALRIGAGMVTVATLPEHATLLPSLPEVMVYDIDGVKSLAPLLEKATVCVIGPGLGESLWADALFEAAISAQLPLVIDASALRLLAKNPQHDDNWVLTPHPGEAAGLLSCSIADISLDRCKSAELIQKQYGGAVVLKGAGSIVTSGEGETYICTAGNPGMASAGMGDVLSGVIGGLLAQGVPLANAAKLGVWLHARAADYAVATQGERGLLASDLMPYLRREVNKCI